MLLVNGESHLVKRAKLKRGNSEQIMGQTSAEFNTLPASRTRLCHQPLSVDVGQCQCRERACGVLGHAPDSASLEIAWASLLLRARSSNSFFSIVIAPSQMMRCTEEVRSVRLKPWRFKRWKLPAMQFGLERRQHGGQRCVGRRFHP